MYHERFHPRWLGSLDDHKQAHQSTLLGLFLQFLMSTVEVHAYSLLDNKTELYFLPGSLGEERRWLSKMCLLPWPIDRLVLGRGLAGENLEVFPAEMKCCVHNRQKMA